MRSAKTLTPSHMKQCILSESRFDFLKDLVKNIPDASSQEDNDNNAAENAATRMEEEEETVRESKEEAELPNYYTEQGTSAGRTPVIQYGPKVTKIDPPRTNFSVESLVRPENKLQVDVTNIPALIPTPLSLPLPQTHLSNKVPVNSSLEPNSLTDSTEENLPQLIPILHNLYAQNTGDNLYIDEDYDN